MNIMHSWCQRLFNILIFGCWCFSTHKKKPHISDSSHIHKVNNFLASPLPMALQIKKSVLLPTYIYNAKLRLFYFSLFWKVAVVILVPKPSKPKNMETSSRLISLLPTLGKIFGKLLLKRIWPILKENNIIPNIQFGFRTKHSTMH